MKTDVHGVATTLLHYLFRRRPITGAMITAGITILGLTLVDLPSGEFHYGDAERTVALSIKAGEFVPSWLHEWGTCLGFALVFGGAVVGILDLVHRRRLESRRKNFVLELRGLHSSPDTPPSASALGLPRWQTETRVIDFRPTREGDLVDPDLALEKLEAMKRDLEGSWRGRARDDVSLSVGGLAATPCLFLAGMLLDDESSIVVYDWDRRTKEWRLADGPDDGKRMLPVTLDAVTDGAKEVVLAVSVSYSVDEDALRRRSEPQMPVIHLRAEEPLIDRFWSAEKQQACVVAFTDTVQELDDAGVTRIHLVLVGPASLAIRMGMAYDRRLMPELLVHQYERTSSEGYPWALQMPTHGRRASVVRYERDIERPQAATLA